MENSNKKIWFRSKRFGLGWYPITWQGWLVVLIYVAIILFLAFGVDRQKSDGNLLIGLIVPVFVTTVVMILICRLKGEKLQWRWGKDKK